MTTLTVGRSDTGRPENCFDALRLFAALCVAITHATAHLNSNFLWYREGSSLWFFDGVMMFFILSGGMVYKSAERCMQQGRPIREYLFNRFLRVVPAIYAYLAIMTLILITLKIINLKTVFATGFLTWIGSGLLLVPVYHPASLQDFGIGVVNGSLWTIPVEVGFYFMIPALVSISDRWGFVKTMGAALALGTAGTLTYALLGGNGTHFTMVKVFGITFLPWLTYFVIGIITARFWQSLPQHRFVALTAATLLIVCNVWRTQVSQEATLLVGLATAIPLAYLTFWIGHRAPAFLRQATSRLGDLSFGIYIWHMPLINLIIWSGLSSGPLHGTGLIVATLGATLSIAYISWHLVERPALRLKRYSSHRTEGPSCDAATETGLPEHIYAESSAPQNAQADDRVARP
jgi:peptidoglycan/LPS O-acetylase OafA/YrhL